MIHKRCESNAQAGQFLTTLKNSLCSRRWKEWWMETLLWLQPLWFLQKNSHVVLCRRLWVLWPGAHCRLCSLWFSVIWSQRQTSDLSRGQSQHLHWSKSGRDSAHCSWKKGEGGFFSRNLFEFRKSVLSFRRNGLQWLSWQQEKFHQETKKTLKPVWFWES